VAACREGDRRAARLTCPRAAALDSAVDFVVCAGVCTSADPRPLRNPAHRPEQAQRRTAEARSRSGPSSAGTGTGLGAWPRCLPSWRCPFWRCPFWRCSNSATTSSCSPDRHCRAALAHGSSRARRCRGHDTSAIAAPAASRGGPHRDPAGCGAGLPFDSLDIFARCIAIAA